MNTALYTHPSSLKHDTSAGHPERIARIEAVNEALAGDSWSALIRHEAPRATKDQLVRVHDSRYVDLVLNNIPEDGFARLDADTVMSPCTGDAALHAAGAIIAAVDTVASGDADNAFCAIRPPGHHAEPGNGMGFCFFNNVAIGALHARIVHGLERVAIVDFDVHHGNGTQAAFESDPNTLFASRINIHIILERVQPKRRVSHIFNAPLDAGDGGPKFRQALEDYICQRSDRFSLILSLFLPVLTPMSSIPWRRCGLRKKILSGRP